MELEAITAATELNDEPDEELDMLMELDQPRPLFGKDPASTDDVMGGALGKDEFLKLLTMQLTHQDPLAPMDSTAMVSQLAQFSALEQMENLNTQFEAFREQSLIQAMFVLQGQSVCFELLDGETVEGIVEKILWSSDDMRIQVAGELYSLDSITGITLLNQDPESESEAVTG